MHLRKNKRMKTTGLDSSFMQSEEFWHQDSAIDKEEQLDRLQFCMEQLQDEQKKSVQLFYLENKCYNEITEITGLEWNKVRSLIQNGRRNLKICMDKNG